MTKLRELFFFQWKMAISGCTHFTLSARWKPEIFFGHQLSHKMHLQQLSCATKSSSCDNNRPTTLS